MKKTAQEPKVTENPLYPWRILQAGKVTCAEGVIG